MFLSAMYCVKVVDPPRIWCSLPFCRQIVDVLTDRKWHQMCVLLSSKTSAWAIYLDGKRAAYGTYDQFSSVRKDGLLDVAKYGTWTKRILMTQLNLWDRFLTSQEIATFAETCNQGIGNLVPWSDFYDDARSSSYSKPSTCLSIPKALTSSIVPPVSTKPNKIQTSHYKGIRKMRIYT